MVVCRWRRRSHLGSRTALSPRPPLARESSGQPKRGPQSIPSIACTALFRVENFEFSIRIFFFFFFLLDDVTFGKILYILDVEHLFLWRQNGNLRENNLGKNGIQVFGPGSRPVWACPNAYGPA